MVTWRHKKTGSYGLVESTIRNQITGRHGKLHREKRKRKVCVCVDIISPMPSFDIELRKLN